jgi:hypothetical protein
MPGKRQIGVIAILLGGVLMLRAASPLSQTRVRI